MKFEVFYEYSVLRHVGRMFKNHNINDRIWDEFGFQLSNDV